MKKSQPKPTEPLELEKSVVKPGRTCSDYDKAYDALSGKLFDIFPESFWAWLTHETDYYVAPASAKHHFNCEGGLFAHSVNVAELLIYYTRRNGLIWDRPESPIIIGLYHDLCKINFYSPEKKRKRTDKLDRYGNPVWVDDIYYAYNDVCPVGHHGDRSLILLMEHVNLTLMEKFCIRWHMGTPDNFSEIQAYMSATSVCPNILWTNMSDHMACVLEKQMGHLAIEYEQETTES